MSNSGLEPLSDRLKNTSLFSCDNNNKPDFRVQLDLGSPVSPLRASGPTPSSSSSSSGSVSGRASHNPASKAHSGELSDTSGAHPRIRPRHARSNSCGSHPMIYSGGGGGAASVNSPPPQLNVLPTGNICPSGRIQKTSGLVTRQPTRSDVLGSGTGNYGHGNIVRIGGCGGDTGKRVGAGLDPEEVKRVANEQYKRGNFSEALSLYDRAIAISPANAAYRSNRAAALTGLGRISEAVRECEEAVRLDPGYGRAHQRLGSLLIRLGHVEVARKHICYAGQQPEATELHKLQAVEKHLSRCSDARKIGDWKGALREGDAAIAAGADFSPQLVTCRAECLLKLQQLDDIDSIISNVPKINPSPNCCSQSLRMHLPLLRKLGRLIQGTSKLQVC